jgi:hypothetical protein
MAGAPDYRLQNRRHLEQRRRYDLDTRPGGGPSNLADILERVLDKGIVIAGDIQINLLDIELLTIKLRLLVASVDRAKEMGINWWESDPTLSRGAEQLEEENRQLRDRLERLEQAMGLEDGGEGPPALAAGEGSEEETSGRGAERSGRSGEQRAAGGRGEQRTSDARG